ncbi:hypothetical protein ACORG1_20260 [Mycobacterium sp. TJFP1]
MREAGPLIAVTPWRQLGDAVAHAAVLLQALEVGKSRLAGPHTSAGRGSDQLGSRTRLHQPDRVAALVVAHDALLKGAGVQMQVVVPMGRLGDRSRREHAPGISNGATNHFNPWARQSGS